MSETPENTPEATIEALQAELERLRTKNVELLAELKTAKATATDAQAALDALQGERDAALADVRALRLDGPVGRALADVSVDAELFGQMFGRHYKFALDDNGAIVILDKDGNPAIAKEPDVVTYAKDHRGRPTRSEASRTPGKERPARFPDDVALLAQGTPDAEKFEHLFVRSRASGGGAPGSPAPLSTMPPPSDKPAPAAPPQPQFGIR